MSALQVIGPIPSLHREEMLDLIAKVFSFSGYYTFLNYLKDGGYLDDSHYDWAASRIGLVDGRIVSHFGVWDYQTRVGRSAQLRTGGIGVVATHGEHRKRGYMDETARASVRAMRGLGYDISILFGIDNFYHRFGYTRAWSDERYTIQTRDLPDGKPKGRIHEISARPDPRRDALFNRCFAGTTGTAIRPTYSRLLVRPEATGRGWGQSAGQLAGYVLYWIEQQKLTCFEACGDAEQALRVLGQLARDNGCASVVFETLPHTSDLARLLRRGTAQFTRQYARRGDAMIRVINLPQALEKMSRELERRLDDTALCRWRGDLVIAGAKETAHLSISDGHVTARPGPARTPHRITAGDEVAQLLIGTDDPLEIAASYEMRLSGDAKRLLPVLFPNQHPNLHRADRY